MNTINIVQSVLDKLDKCIKIDWKGLKQILKCIPRTWKYVRILKYNLDLPIQNLYDHILSLAYNSDILNNIYSDYITDLEMFAYMIAFHDLPEIYIWDVPDFTNQQLSGNYYLTKEQKINQENKINLQIYDMLQDMEKAAFHKLILNKDFKPELEKYFEFIDKSEPILSVWRYVFQFRQNIDINLFLDAMTDFFDNPKPKTKAIDQDSFDFLDFLQRKSNIKIYYELWNESFPDIWKIKNEVFENLIENNKICFL